GSGLELGEIELPHPVTAQRRIHKRFPAVSGQLAAFGLIRQRLQQIPPCHGPFHRRLRPDVPAVGAGDRPDLPMPHASHDSAYLATVGSIRTLHRRRPRPLLKVAGPPPGQPVVIGAARHPDQLSEPRDRELGFDTDHLEVTEGGRYSAPFRHTRNWTWASPRAAFNSSFST